MGKLRLLVADDHRLMLDAIRSAVAAADDIEIVGEARTGAQVLPLLNQTKPNVLLLDIRMPQMDGLQVLERMRDRYPDVKVVVLSGSDDPEIIQRALAAGACAYVLKHVDPRDLPSAIRQAAEGTVFQAPAGALLNGENSAAKEAGLSDRELEVLQALARGLSNKQIAKQGWVTEQTVKFHLSNIYRKLGVANRTEATRFAYQHGLVDSPVLDAS
jgi:DNA-binding NarL/FixJ family response regulator